MLQVYDYHTDPKVLAGYELYTTGAEQATKMVESKLNECANKYGDRFKWTIHDTKAGADYQIHVQVKDDMQHVGTVTFNKVGDSTSKVEIALYEIQQYGHWYDGKFTPTFSNTEAHDVMMFDFTRMQKLKKAVDKFLQYIIKPMNQSDESEEE